MTNTLKSIILSSALLIGISSNAQADASKCTSSDCKSIAQAVYFEARGEGHQGMVAVANVIKNRTKERKLSASQVVAQKGQFSYRTRGSLAMPDKKSYAAACSVAHKVMSGAIGDNTHGATYFRTVSSGTWGRQFKQTTRIGSHAFFKQTK